MKKQRVVEENLRKVKEADQRHNMETKDQTNFLKTPLGIRLKAAILKMIKKKITDENNLEMRH